MKISLTEYQAQMVVTALEWAQNPDFPDSDPINKSYQRIIDKINKRLKEYYNEKGIDYETPN